jgi:hypothetical protein
MVSAVLLVSLALASCTASLGGSAEVLDTPFPAKVLELSGQASRCSDQGCRISYRIDVTNPTDRDANVQTCTLTPSSDGTEPIELGIVNGLPAGLSVPAGKTRVGIGGPLVIPVQFADLDGLRNGSVTCTGLDWQGHPPI